MGIFTNQQPRGSYYAPFFIGGTLINDVVLNPICLLFCSCTANNIIPLQLLNFQLYS